MLRGPSSAAISLRGSAPAEKKLSLPVITNGKAFPVASRRISSVNCTMSSRVSRLVESSERSRRIRPPGAHSRE